MSNECNGAAPHTCPECGEPAYLGFNVPGRCVERSCRMYDQDLWVEWVILLPDREEGVEFEVISVPDGREALRELLSLSWDDEQTDTGLD